MFYVTYMFSELRRRSGRTILTALGLALGVGLVVTVTALSAGLDQAQDDVLKPLTGVGTDMSVTRPISFDANGGGFPQLSDAERRQLREENGPRRFGLRNLGEPGTKFSRDDFVAATQLSFADSVVSTITGLAGVSTAAGGLTLNAIHLEGTVPEQTQQPGVFRGPPQAGQDGGPRDVDVTAITVSGVDERNRELGAITPAQVTSGRYFGTTDAREAVLDTGYAARQGLTAGETVSLGGKKFTVVGLASTPLGGQASDVYVKLSQLQALSDRKGRVNTVYVRAKSSEQVGALARHIRDTVDGASVTTAKDLADRVSGSLVDAKNLAGKLGTALALVGLLAAFLIASLLTLSSVAKRVRELGTLKALGWSQWLVVRQVSGEALVAGVARWGARRAARARRCCCDHGLRPRASGELRDRPDRVAEVRPLRPGSSRDRRLDGRLSRRTGQQLARAPRGRPRAARRPHRRCGRRPPRLASSPRRCPPPPRLMCKERP